MEVLRIDVGRGMSTTVDAELFETPKRLVFLDGYELTITPSRYRWGVMPTHTGYVYNRIDRPGGRRLTVYLHRLLMECPVGMSVNHINFDTLRNTRDNLEIVTAAENSAWQRRRLTLFERLGVRNCTELRQLQCVKYDRRTRRGILLDTQSMHEGVTADFPRS